jgi:hypothetical protein
MVVFYDPVLSGHALQILHGVTSQGTYTPNHTASHTSITTHQTTRRHISQHRSLHNDGAVRTSNFASDSLFTFNNLEWVSWVTLGLPLLLVTSHGVCHGYNTREAAFSVLQTPRPKKQFCMWNRDCSVTYEIRFNIVQIAITQRNRVAAFRAGCAATVEKRPTNEPWRAYGGHRVIVLYGDHGYWHVDSTG